MNPEFEQGLFENLRELAAGSFPKTCASCGHIYRDLAQFLAQTLPVRPDHSGLKAGYDEDDKPLVELFRNCFCGSTLMDFCHNRRDESPDGLRRRALFDQLLTQLQQHGMSRDAARAQLLELLRSGRSPTLARLLQSRHPDQGNGS